LKKRKDAREREDNLYPDFKEKKHEGRISWRRRRRRRRKE
jgi:hypothetical protein